MNRNSRLALAILVVGVLLGLAVMLLAINFSG